MLRRIDWEVVWRIACCLDNGETGRTRLATACRMNYASCMRYLDWMGWMGLVTLGAQIRLTRRGLLATSVPEYGRAAYLRRRAPSKHGSKMPHRIARLARDGIRRGGRRSSGGRER